MTKYVRETKAAKSTSAIIVMKGAKHVATINAYHGEMTCTVNIWCDMFGGIQIGKGRDLVSALAGLKVAGHTLSDHCAVKLTKPKGRKFWPMDAKRKGYSAANLEYYSLLDGVTIDRQVEIRKLMDNEGLEYNDAQVIIDDMLRSGHVTKGWCDMYKKAGLEYLRDFGYTIIQAI